AQGRIVRFEDHPHAACAELPEHLVAAPAPRLHDAGGLGELPGRRRRDPRRVVGAARRGRRPCHRRWNIRLHGAGMVTRRVRADQSRSGLQRAVASSPAAVHRARYIRRMRSLISRLALAGAAAVLVSSAAPNAPAAPAAPAVLTGKAAMGDWTTDAPGVRRKLVPGDLPVPYATKSAENSATIVARPKGAQPRVPDGFVVDRLTTEVSQPRMKPSG